MIVKHACYRRGRDSTKGTSFHIIQGESHQAQGKFRYPETTLLAGQDQGKERRDRDIMDIPTVKKGFTRDTASDL